VDIRVSAISDLSAQITIDGPPVTVATTSPGQDARLVFPATPAQRVAILVTNSTNPSAIVELLGVTGEILTRSSIGNNPSATFFVDSVSLVASGRYTILMQHNGTGFGSATFQLISVPPDFTAPISMGGAAVRVPATGDTAMGQNGVLTFSATSGQKVSINVSNGTYGPPYTNCIVHLFNPNQVEVTSGYCGSGAPGFIDTVALSVAGTYTLFIDPQGIATGNTTIQLNDSSDVTGTISADGSSLISTTGFGQDARYTFNAIAGERIALGVSNVTNPSATVFLLKPDGTTQASLNISNSPAGQTFFMDTQTLVTAGTYTIWIKHSGSNAGSATLQLSTVPQDYTANLTLGTAAQIPNSCNLAVGQNARLTFTGNAGFQLNTLFSNNTLPVTVSLLSTNGTTVISSVTSSAASFSLPTTMLPSDGTYTLVIDPSGPATGSISVVCTQVGGPRPVPTRIGNAIDPSNPLSANLVGLFLMNEGTGTTDANVVDGQVATFSSNASTPPVWNTTDPSVAFNGTTSSLSSYLDAGTDLNFDQMPTNKITVVAKIFLNSVRQGGIVEKNEAQSTGFTFLVDGTGALNGYVLKSVSPMRVATGAGAVSSGQWVQVAFTWDGTVGTASAAHIYVNGVEQTKAVAQDGSGVLNYVNATNKSLRIGNNGYNTNLGALNGKIAYVAVYKGRILTNLELNQLDTQLPIH